MGLFYFVKQYFSICVYHGKKILRKIAYANQNKSHCIMEVTNHYDRPLCIAGWDETHVMCYNKGGYTNDTIGWGGAKKADGPQSL